MIALRMYQSSSFGDEGLSVEFVDNVPKLFRREETNGVVFDCLLLQRTQVFASVR